MRYRLARIARRLLPSARVVLGSLMACLLLQPLQFARGADQPPKPRSSAGDALFETKIRPLLVENCQACHGPEKQKGGLRLDSLAALLTGGDSGPGAVPGRPQESIILQAIQYSEDLKMPPKGKLSPVQIAAVSEWITLGAPWPSSGPALSEAPKASGASGGFTAQEKEFWAFQPPTDRPIPAVKRQSWVQSPIDAFILSGLEAKGLAPATPADRRTLIRRATFDLIGIPPTPEEVAAFERDPSPDAFAKVIDRLLASPRYGERWGRHWLDVARYADSNGMDENLAFGNAWRYRDYVVRAFNSDRPYNRFLAEQIAGDLLQPQPGEAGHAAEDDRHIATGFLVVGPKMLAEDDPMKMEMDIIDEQVDTIGRTFLGLTLGCARCHDHKFDPIRSTDYYGLAGIFKSTKTMEHYKVVARWNEHPLGPSGDGSRIVKLAEGIKAQKARIDAAVNEANQAARDEHSKKKSDAPLPRKLEPLYPQATRDRLKGLRDELARLQAEEKNIPTAMAVADREPTDLKVHVRGSHLTLGAPAPRRFPAVLTGLDRKDRFGPKESGRRQLTEWLTQPDHPLTSRVMVNRLWLWHFGAALVRSPDNFGRLGERPTHPELLDWLARTFVQQGWSIKKIHRTIMLSATYQMSTTHNENAAAIDPENRLWWRMNRRRLEAESIRDSILAVGGQLDSTFGGNLLKTANREYVAGTASVNGATYQSFRRSLYLPIIRSALYELLQAFDFADPSTPNGQRDTTTVAPQALCLMNSDLVADASSSLAGQILSGPTGDSDRVGRVYSIAYGRAPTSEETSRALAFLNRYQQTSELTSVSVETRRHKAWQGFCRAILESSEFIYID